MTVRAIVQTGVRQLELQTFDLPEIGPEDGLLRVEHSGVCGSDWSIYSHGIPFASIPGHEPLGIIEEIGDVAAQRWGVKKGDRVAVETMLPCGYCRDCVQGKYNRCRPPGTRLISAIGYQPIDRAPHLWGGHAEYMYLEPHTLLHKVDADIPAEIAVMFNPLGAGVRWAQRMPNTGIGEVVVVLGCGQRGLTSVVAAHAAGAAMIIVTGLAVDAHKMEIAMEFGATRTVNVEEENIVSVVREMTDNRGADVVVEVTSEALQPINDALDIAARSGRIILGGMKYAPVPEFDTRKIMAKELIIQGAFAVDYESYEAAIRLIESKRYPLELMHTHNIPLAEADRAMRILGNEVEGEKGIHISLVP